MNDLREPGTYPDVQHPDADQLNAFVEHVLPEHEHRQTLDHLADCATCRNIVGLCSVPRLEELPAVVPVEESRPSSVSWLQSRRLAWIAAPAVAALLILVAYLQSRSRVVNPAMPSASVAGMHEPVKDAEPAVAAISKASATPSRALPPAPPLAAPTVPGSKVADTTQSINKLPPKGAGSTHGAKKSPTTGSRSLNRSLHQQEYASQTASAARPQASALKRAAAPDVLPSVTVAASNSNAAASSGGEESGAVGDLLGEINGRQSNTPVSLQAALPSGLSILSSAASQRQRIAVDTGHRLFFSEDAGHRWVSVPSPWRGRAIAVSRIARAAAAPQSSPQAVAFAVPERFIPGETAVVESDTPGDSVSGKITDASGTPIPHAAVVLIESRTGMVRKVETGGSGTYIVTNFVPGLYLLEVRASGFEGQSLLADLSSVRQAVRSIALHAGSAAQTLTVRVSNEPLEPEFRHPSGFISKSRRPSTSPPTNQLPQPAIFVVTTDIGERWISSDGKSWKPE